MRGSGLASGLYFKMLWNTLRAPRKSRRVYRILAYRLLFSDRWNLGLNLYTFPISATMFEGNFLSTPSNVFRASFSARVESS
jgi:hypothetical protein